MADTEARARRSRAASLPEFPAAARERASAWFVENQTQLPPEVVAALQLALNLADRISTAQRRSVVMQLQKALGIIPSTERRKSGAPLADIPKEYARRRMTKKQRLEEQCGRLERLSDWHSELARQQQVAAEKKRRQIMNLPEEDLTSDEDNEAMRNEAAAVAQEKAEYQARLALGGRCDLECVDASETLMRLAAAVDTDSIECLVDESALPNDAVIVRRLSDERQRIDFTFSVRQVDIAVEKVVIDTPTGQKMVSADVDAIGPPKMRVTWLFLVNLVLLVCQWGVPFNRFAMMLSSTVKRFTAGEIGRYFFYVAERFAHIYLVLANDLANAEVLSGDDTSTRVLEVRTALKERENGSPEEMPWAAYATKEQATKTLAAQPDPELAVRLAAELGFSSARKDGKGDKQELHTTVLTGRKEQADPRSAIVFYRSHIGGLGNLLDVILSKRDRTKSDVVIQSDLSTVNLVNRDILKSLRVAQAGCAAHARRPFALHEKDEPEFCEWILHAFKGLAIYEECISFAGRNTENTTAVRRADGRKQWEMIRTCCELAVKKWPATTEIGEAARYIIRHYDKLTYYLTDHRVAPSNNFSERMLRMEKVIQNGALFRKTLSGRFALDIMRTITQTVTAARIDHRAYLMWVLTMPPDVVASAPEQFTPLAYIRCHGIEAEPVGDFESC